MECPVKDFLRYYMIGIDIIEITRFKKIKKRDFQYWRKFFTKKEWDFCFLQPKPSQHLAGIFAAKEAVIKALDNKFLGRFDLIEIVHDRKGRPKINLMDKTPKNVNISISHDKSVAIAIAFIG